METALTAPTIAEPATKTPKKKHAEKKPENGKPQKKQKNGASLSKNQLLVLTILSKADRSLTRPQIIAKSGPGKADSNGSWIVKPLGQWDKEARAESKIAEKSLIGRGLVKPVKVMVDGHDERRYEITDKGKKALADK